MSSLEDRRSADLHSEPAVTAPPTARQRDLLRMEAQGAAAMRPFLMLGSALEGRRLPRLVRVAQVFLISFACIAPVLLFLRVAF